MTLRRAGDPGLASARAFETIWNRTASSTSLRLVSSVSVINLIVFSSHFPVQTIQTSHAPAPEVLVICGLKVLVRRSHATDCWLWTQRRFYGEFEGLDSMRGKRTARARQEAPADKRV